MKRSVRILQIGTYSSHNKGDAAMELSAATEFLERIDGARVTIQTPFPELDETAYPGVRVSRTTRRRLLYNSLLVSRAALWTLCRRLGKPFDALIENPEIREFLAADVVVDLSGDMLTEDYGVHVAYSHYLPLMMALALERPLAVCAQSIGPFKWTRPIARRIFERAKLITVRDRISFDYLKELGVQNANLHQTADMAFLLRPAAPARIDEILQTERVPREPRALIGVSVSDLIAQRYRAWNTLSRGIPFEQLMADILDAVAADLGARVLFVSHVTGPAKSKDDRVVSRAVVKRLRAPAFVLQGDYAPDELKGVIARTQLFFGARMHANIAALSSGVPTVAISYSHKTEGIAQALGQEERVLPIRSLDAPTARALLLGTWQRRAEITASLEERLVAVRREAARNVELLLEVLEASSEAARARAPSETAQHLQGDGVTATSES